MPPRLPPLDVSVLHPSLAQWVHKTMVLARFVGVIGSDGAMARRVVCASPGLLFVCMETGEVRRVIRVAQLEGVIDERGEAGADSLVLVRCKTPEPDLLLVQVSDDRNEDRSEDTLPSILATLAGSAVRISERAGGVRRSARLSRGGGTSAPAEESRSPERIPTKTSVPHDPPASLPALSPPARTSAALP
eukprot:Hpha_TRINITY_DN4370_c0_g1::TRINITY_DN4370_c0_g1_i1::g.50284::m.50284